MYVHIHIYIYIYMCVYVYVYLWVYVCTYVCMHACMCMYTHKHAKNYAMANSNVELLLLLKPITNSRCMTSSGVTYRSNIKST